MSTWMCVRRGACFSAPCPFYVTTYINNYVQHSCSNVLTQLHDQTPIFQVLWVWSGNHRHDALWLGDSEYTSHLWAWQWEQCLYLWRHAGKLFSNTCLCTCNCCINIKPAMFPMYWYPLPAAFASQQTTNTCTWFAVCVYVYRNLHFNTLMQ